MQERVLGACKDTNKVSEGRNNSEADVLKRILIGLQ